MKRTLLIAGIMLVFLVIPTLLLAQPANFATSLHATRQGKVTFYSASNNGFELLTGVAIADLGCLKCHPDTLANGTPVNPTTYTPGCNDCHNIPGDSPDMSVCLKCHGRMKTEIYAFGFTDVHRDSLGFKCSNCHTTGDIHGDGTSYNSMFDPGAMDVECTNCHTNPPTNPEHNQHLNDIHCAACHVKSSVTCYNCHFNSMVQAHIKRAYTKVKDFMLLGVRSKDNKIFPATYMVMYYHTPDGKDTSFVTYGPYFSHSVQHHGRTCGDCHNNANIQTYNSSGELWMAQWDATQNALVTISGVVPMPPDYQTSLRYVFLNYTGQIDTTYTNPNAWVVAEDEADLVQNLGYILPLSTEQMNKLATPQSIDDNTNLPTQFELKQNYPNPFNPGTVIEFTLPKSTRVTLKVYNLLGEEVATLLENQHLTPGTHRVDFRAHSLTSGVYFYKLQTPEYSQIRKMCLLK